LSIIKHLKPTADNYKLAWDLLKKKYDKSDNVKNANLDLLLKQANIKHGTTNEVRMFDNKVNESYNALKVLDETTKHWDTILIFMFEKKLDPDNSILWYRKKIQLEEMSWTMLERLL